MTKEELRQAHVEQIAFFTENPDQIVEEWANSCEDPKSLFYNSPRLGEDCCLTLAKMRYVKNYGLSRESRTLMDKLGISYDPNIPTLSKDIKPEHLESFSKYQIMLAFGEE